MQYKQIADFVIDNLEGGYYHPDMLLDGRVTDPRYSTSGETMFGIDRLNGGSINYSQAGIEFWKIIDNANARHTWAWNYKGGTLGPKLRELAARIMWPVYEAYAIKNLSAKARRIVEDDPRLYFHFIYAAWNGPLWFYRFAVPINKAVAEGTTNPDKLTEIAVESRINNVSGSSLISQGGIKIKQIIDKLKENKAPVIVTLAILTGLFFGVRAIVRRRNKRK